METQQNMTVDRPKFNIGFFFLCLGVLISLVTSVTSLLNLVFDTLDKRFPDVLNSNYQYGYSTYDYESIRMALATLIIFFPVFIIISYFWEKQATRGVGRIDQGIRKWLMYIILFLSAIVVAVDLVTLVRYFVSGEITNRFILKVLAALVVAGFVGVYYILELKGKEKIFKCKVGTWAAIKSCALVLAAIVWSFSVIGTPGQQRIWRLDDRRVGDLQSVQWQVINFWQQKQKLPATLNDLVNPLSGYSLPVDPEFQKGKKYEYAVKGPMTFELCAEFSLPMPKGWHESSGGYGGVMPMADTMNVSYPYPGPGGGANESWDHQAGRTCFERTIDKDIYPPYPKPQK